ncbi:unnamed protein product [Urochloa decumbens]|uniref:DC-UbP/UBTD2 N-terminal domain-containing protein n=1 Tax=Urochloa decumbens TaxID=240449 RepID=A0ABC8YQ36_9POAL
MMAFASDRCSEKHIGITTRQLKGEDIFSFGAKDNGKKLKKPKPWKHTQAITPAQLRQMRDEFWDTAPHYGGQKEIWDALRAAADSDLALAQTIVDSAGIIVSNSDMTLCYDERGAKYELPKYVLSEPTNLIRDG